MIAGLLLALNALSRTYSCLYMIIADCDETYNYWEPLNFILRGFGKRTWEYSPEYAIRSYAYLLPYVAADIPFKTVADYLQLPSYASFYFIRFLLSGFTLYSEWRLFFAIKNRTTAKWFLFFSTIAPGMAHAGVALLPSSLAMQCASLALSAALEDSVVESFSWILLGGLGGWPFALALAVPYGLYVLGTRTKLALVFLGTLSNLVFIAGTIVVVDYFFYKKWVFVPVNIVLYNVFGGEGVGPEIYGVEDASYYVLNLLVNFNVVAVLGYVGVAFFRFNKTYLVVNGPLLLWSAIFFSQPHKEERFLYPIYPFILVNAAIVANKVFDTIRSIVGYKSVVVGAKTLFAAATMVLSVLRIASLVVNYSAPLTVLEQLQTNIQPYGQINVCVGREWYHFPTSFFLPDNYRLQFVKSGVDILFPGDFEGDGDIFQITSSVDENMNNRNIFSNSTVIPLEECHYYIDTSGPVADGEPHIILAEEPVAVKDGWTIEKCAEIIDPNAANGIGRLIWIPPALRGVVPYTVHHRQFCLVARSVV